MPKLTRKQRARGAKEKLDQLCAPALRTLRLNLLNVRAWMQPEQIEKGQAMPSEEDLCHDMETNCDLLSPQELFLRQISTPKRLVTPEEPGLEAPEIPNLSVPRVRLDMEAVDRQAVPMTIISPHNAEVAKARQWKRWESAFQRLQNQGEVDKELLMQAIELAGFTIQRQEWMEEVAADITTYTTLDCDEFMRFLQNYEAKQYDVFITVFRHFDVDGNGHLESDELAALLENCGITALDQVLKEILVEVAPVDSSHLTLEEFRRVIEIITVNEGFSSREIMKLKEVFRRFDLDRGGFLDTGELHKAMAWLGFAISPEEAAEISNSCDIGGKGQLEEHEFFAFMRKVKEREITLVKKALAKQPQNAAGNVYMQKQLDRVLRTLGYIPNAQAIRDAAEDAGIIRVNPAEAVELHHGTQPFKSSTARRQSFQSMGSRRTSVFTMATAASSRRASASSSRRDSAHSSHGTNEMALDDFPKTITLSSFFGFLEVYRQREGLARCQIMELEAALKKYDKTGYGEIDTKDVGKVLRWMGYASGFNVQLMLVSEVDVDESGTLDAVELRKLLRKFQEKELTAWTAAFHNALPYGEKYLEVEACVRTLRGVGIKATEEQVESTREAIASSFSSKKRFSTIMQAPHMADLAKLRNNILLKPTPQTAENSSSSSFAADASESSEEESENEDDNGNIDLAVFHLICSKLVAEAKQSIRENAGYTWEEVQRMREKFRKFDRDGSGDIDNHEMAKLVQDLCPDLATNVAKRAEITRILSEVDPDKSGHVDFPDFLRLMRQVDEMQDRLRMAKETFAIEKSKFSSREVEEFRKLFLGEEDSLGCFRGMLRVDEFLKLLEPVVGLGRSNEAELTQLFFTIDAHMKPEFAEKVVAPASPKGQSYGAIGINNPRVAVDFPEFLILMSLLLKKNLCQVKEKSSILAQRSSGRKTLTKAPSRLH